MASIWDFFGEKAGQREKPMGISDVPFFERPAFATDNDTIIGVDELDNPVYLTPSGRKYTVSINPNPTKDIYETINTTSGKILEAVPAVADWIVNTPRDEKRDVIGKGATALGQGIADYVARLSSGEGTMGDAFEIALNTAFPGVVATKGLSGGLRGLLDYNPNTLGSMGGNIRLRPQAGGPPVMQGRSKKGLEDFFNPDGLSWGTTNRETAEQFAGRNEVYWPYRDPPESTVEFSGEVYDLNFDLRNPMDVDISQTMWDRNKELALVAEAKAAGHDGLRISHPGGKIDYVAFDPSQVSRSTPPSPAQEVAGLLSSGRADEVTDEMLAKFTPKDEMEIFDLYQRGATGMDLPMDEASRMARAQGVRALHGTGVDISAVDPAYFGNGQDLLGTGFYTTTKPERADRYVPRRKSPSIEMSKEYAEGGNVMPLMVREPRPFVLDEPLGGAADEIASIYKQDPFFDVDEMSSGVKIVRDGDGKSVMLDPYQQRHWALQNMRKSYGPSDTSDVLSEAGYSGVSGPEGAGGRVRLSYDPTDIRSIFARFDPRLAHLRNLSAGVGGLGLLSTMMPQEEQY